MEQENQQAEQTFRPRERRQPRHFWADNEIVSNYLPQIGVYGFSVYMLLCYHANAKTGKAFPSIATMAKKLEVSEPTIRSALEKLQKARLIQISHRTKMSKNGKEVPTNNYYTLLTVQKNKQGVVNQVDQGGKPHLPGVVNQVSPNNTKYNKTQGTISLSNDSDLVDGSGEPPRTPPELGSDRPLIVPIKEEAKAVDSIMGQTEPNSIPQSSLVSEITSPPTPSPLPVVTYADAQREAADKVRAVRQDSVTWNEFEAMLKAHAAGMPPTVVTTGTPAQRRVIADNPPPERCEWWYSAEGVQTVAHLLKGGKGRPLCKPKHWKYPNKCMQQVAYTLCEECLRVAAEPVQPKAEKKSRPANPAFDAIAKYVFKLDKTPSGGAIGTMIKSIKGCLDEKHHATLGEDLTNAFAWWTSKPAPDGGTFNAPTSALKICRMLTDWREAGSPAAPAETDEVWGLVDDPKNPGFQMYGWVKKGGA